MSGERDLIRASRGIDLFKFLVAIIVVGGHCFPLQDRTDFFGVLIDLLWEIPVPYFFIATGYSIFSKIPDGSSPVNAASKLKMRIFGYGKMYVYWAMIYFPLEVFGYRDSPLGFGAYVFTYIKKFFLDGRNFYSWQLWYLLSTVYGLVVVLTLIKRKKLLVFISLLLFFSAAFLHWMMAFAWPLYEGNPLIRILRQICYYEKLPYSVVYLCIGMLLAEGKIRISRHGAIGITGASLLILNLKWPWVSQVMPVFIVTVLFWWSCNLNLKPHPIWGKLRKASAVLYFSHLLILQVVAMRILGLPNYSVRTFAVVFGGSLTLSWFVIAFNHRFRWMRIFGN